MAYWCDDRRLDIEQRRLDAMQAEAKRKMDAENAKKEVESTRGKSG